jgi:hypothetical protein
VTGELRDWSVQETGKFKGTGQFRGQVISGDRRTQRLVSSGDR